MKQTSPPPGLSKEARELWRSTLKRWPIEKEATLLVCLRNAVFALDRLRAAEKALARTHGHGVYKAKNGTPKQHPLTLVIRDSGKQLHDALRMLSLDLEAVNRDRGEVDPNEYEVEDES